MNDRSEKRIAELKQVAERSGAQFQTLRDLADLSGELSAIGLHNFADRLAELTGRMAESSGHDAETVFWS